MKVEHESEEWVKGSIRACQKKGHIQQVAFSTYHHALTQICFTCNELHTSLKQIEVRGSKHGKSLDYFKDTNSAQDEVNNKPLKDNNRNI